MPVRASRPRGVRGRPRAPDGRRALQQVAYRQAVRAFRTRIVREGARQDRLLSGGHVDVESLERRASEEGLGRPCGRCGRTQRPWPRRGRSTKSRG